MILSQSYEKTRAEQNKSLFFMPSWSNFTAQSDVKLVQKTIKRRENNSAPIDL